MHKSGLHLALVCAFAFLGGFVSDQLFKITNSHAEGPSDITKKSFSNSHETFVDQFGNKRMDIDTFTDHSIQSFYSGNTVRLQFGLYGGPERPGSDGGEPYVSLNDRNGQLRALMRISPSKNQAPILVLKDSKGKDRLIMGTNLSDNDEDAFLAYIDKFGIKHTVFGKF